MIFLLVAAYVGRKDPSPQRVSPNGFPIEIATARTRPHGRSKGDRWLIAGNLLTLSMALWQGWTLIDLLLPFWLQSVAISVLQVVRMLRLKSFSTDGFSNNGQSVPETPAGKRSTAIFFAAFSGAKFGRFARFGKGS